MWSPPNSWLRAAVPTCSATRWRWWAPAVASKLLCRKICCGRTLAASRWRTRRWPRLALYTQEALEGLGLWEKLQPKLLYGPDVRTALQYAASGSVDAAVVYATDVAGAEGVHMLWRFPDDSHRPVRYPAAAIADADNLAGAAAFLVFLRTEEALMAFRSHGFTTP